MSDEWRDLKEGWQRLVWARRQSKFETAQDAAVSLGMQPGTYRAYEREPGRSKATPLTHQTAIRFGRKFKVNWVWLLTGDGEPFGDAPQESRLERALFAAMEAPAPQQELIADVIERLLRAS
jgi:hypothetical protein